MTFVLVQCERPGCVKLHGVKAVKRRHAAYTGPEVSPLRESGPASVSMPEVGPESPNGALAASPDVLTD
jgi:hypothetical protein